LRVITQKKPLRKTVDLKPPARPSRIRRDPIRLSSSAPAERKAAPRTEEQEMWLGVAGIIFVATALVVAILGISIATIFHDDPAAAARAQQFGQCYNGGTNCVVDGDTIQVGGVKVQIAGIEAPHIDDARCEAERDHGIDTAVRLAEILNGGNVTVSPAFRDSYGREVRKVEVKGQDVGYRMIGAGLAREYLGDRGSWC
jgi:endonuclease YncB( thermonuclease family)